MQLSFGQRFAQTHMRSEEKGRKELALGNSQLIRSRVHTPVDPALGVEGGGVIKEVLLHIVGAVHGVDWRGMREEYAPNGGSLTGHHVPHVAWCGRVQAQRLVAHSRHQRTVLEVVGCQLVDGTARQLRLDFRHNRLTHIFECGEMIQRPRDRVGSGLEPGEKHTHLLADVS